jgi:DNA invertase Pin-like site-specific DNA recombinase
MSTDLQLKGDSRRRQLEASRAYAEANGLELADGAELEDIGISAFKGDNVRDGSLGRFLDAVRSGVVKPGSYLIVESLDRLSRQQVLAAQSLFLSIIQAGINLVTLMDGKVYRAGTVDLADLITSLVIMSRAHEESLTKSRRIAAAWKNKRSDASAQKPMTKWCPAWLRLRPDRSGYERIPERVEIVRQIFEDAANGIGMFTVASRLNRANVPTFGGPNGWHQSYVAKILANRAVLGEFQPHIRANGKRVPDGEPVTNYYPAIIDEELFYRAQLGKAQRRESGAGRKGTAFTNLFSGIARCFYCRAPVVFENKGGGPKGGTYLVCESAKRHRDCPSLRWRYRDFEATFLAFVEELDIESIVNDQSQSNRRKELEGELAALKGHLSTVSDLMEKTYAVLSQGGPVNFVTGKLNELEQQRAKLTDDIEAKSRQHAELLSRQTRYHHGREEIRQLVERLQSPSNDELFKLRAQIAAQLKNLIDSLLVGSAGERPRTKAVIRAVPQATAAEIDDVWTYIGNVASDLRQSRRFFAVGFRDSQVRVVFPDEDDPLRYQEQIVADQIWGIQGVLLNRT